MSKLWSTLSALLCSTRTMFSPLCYLKNAYDNNTPLSPLQSATAFSVLEDFLRVAFPSRPPTAHVRSIKKANMTSAWCGRVIALHVRTLHIQLGPLRETPLTRASLCVRSFNVARIPRIIVFTLPLLSRSRTRHENSPLFALTQRQMKRRIIIRCFDVLLICVAELCVLYKFTRQYVKHAYQKPRCKF